MLDSSERELAHPEVRSPSRPRFAQRPVPRWLATVAVVVALWLPGVLLCLNALEWRAGTDLRQLPVARRFWETLAVASSQYLEAAGGPPWRRRTPAWAS